MTVEVKHDADFDIAVDERRVLVQIGYKKKSPPSGSPVMKLIREEKKQLDSLVSARALSTVIDYEQTNRHPIFLHAEKVGLCLCTIGPMLEKRVERLMKDNDILRGLILDAIGSEAVENVAEQMDRILARKAREIGLWPSKRFSPGYGNWDLREQRFLFGILPGPEIGVSLNESFMMVPRKSVSFRINMYKDRLLTSRRSF